MQHECAREKQDGSGWHWVGSHTADCRVRGCAPHPTKEAAETCQRDYEIATRSEREVSSWQGCRECDAPTKSIVQLGGYMGQIIALCDAHRDEAHVRKHAHPVTDRWVS